MQITFNIPNDKLPRIIEAFADRHRPDEETQAFTDAQWAKESIRRFIIGVVFKHERSRAIRNITVQLDDSLVS